MVLVKHAPPFRMASRESHPESTIVTAGAVSIGTGALAVMA